MLIELYGIDIALVYICSMHIDLHIEIEIPNLYMY